VLTCPERMNRLVENGNQVGEWKLAVKMVKLANFSLKLLS